MLFRKCINLLFKEFLKTPTDGFQEKAVNVSNLETFVLKQDPRMGVWGVGCCS